MTAAGAPTTGCPLAHNKQQHLKQHQSSTSSKQANCCKSSPPTAASRRRSFPATVYLLTCSLSVTCSLGAGNGLFGAAYAAAELDADGSPLPQFQQHNNVLHFSVHENKPPGTFLGHIRSSDGTPPYVVVPFAGTSEAERQSALSINLQTGELRTNAVLDREQRDHYTFVAIINSPFTEIKCTVNVLDVNDNAPFFIMASPNDTYVIEIPEGQHSVRRPLPLVFDLDSSKNGVQEFSIRSDDLNTPQSSFFLVDQSAPNRSSLTSTNLSGPDSSLSSAAAAPENQAIKQQLAKLSTILIPSQPTNMQPGSLPGVAAFGGGGGGAGSSASASASGSGSSGVAGSMAGQMFTGFSWAIDLETNITLDRENQSEYHLTVEAFDGALTGRLMVTVRVTDVNDNDPIFARDLYECRIKEDAPKGSPLIRVQAHDADSEANARISYFINRQVPVLPSQSNLISPQQQQTTTNSSNGSTVASASTTSDISGAMPDAALAGPGSKYPQPQPAASANAAASSSSSSSSNLRPRPVAAALSASNSNSLASKLQQAAQQRVNSLGNSNEMHADQPLVLESAMNNNNNKQPGAANKQLATTSYSQQQSEQILFEIEPTKGEISLIHPLDYETNQMFELHIEARDHGKPSRSGFTVVKVFVIDVNDDPPSPPSSLSAGGLSNGRAADQLGDRKSGVQGGAQTADAGSRQESSTATGSGQPGAAMGLGSGRGFGLEIAEATQHYFQNINLSSWFAQANSTMLFFVVIVALLIIAFPVCLVKIKSHQPESDYNDSAGLTLIPNNGQLKASPNHSTSDEHQHPLGPNGLAAANGEIDNHHRQLPPTPCRSNPNAYRSWQAASSTIGFPINYQSAVANEPMPLTSSTMDRANIRQPSNSQQLFERLLEPCISSQHLFARELQGSYNWDYLADWVPDYHTIMYLVTQKSK